MVLPGYSHFGGRHWETAAVCNMLRFHKVVSPHTNKPFSEAFVLGLGGGVGAGYFVFQYGDDSTMFIGTRGLWHKVSGELASNVISRIGGKAAIKQSSSAKPALT